MSKRPTFTMLIGTPASGKSTWREAHLRDGRTTVVLSTDDMIEQWGAERGLNYSEAFRSAPFKQFEKQMFHDMEAAVSALRDIVVDRTNMRRKGRARFLSRLPSDYERIAVVFEVPRDELDRRLSRRAAETGKSIPPFVVNDMITNYEPPGSDEFDRIETGIRSVA